jgi:hypothetical protein
LGEVRAFSAAATYVVGFLDIVVLPVSITALGKVLRFRVEIRFDFAKHFVGEAFTWGRILIQVSKS